MNNQIILITTILSFTIILSTISAEFVTLTPRNVFGQSFMFNKFDTKSSGSPIMNMSNNSMTDDDIVEISTTINTNASSPAPSSNLTGTTPRVTVVDAINSTYAASKGLDQDESERRIARALRDRVNDVLHTIVASNATVITAATITNDFANESTTTNNITRMLEVIPDQVHTAFERIVALSQPTNPLLELHSDIHAICISNDTSVADCNVNVRIH